MFPRSYGGPTPLHRLFRESDGDYLYTTSTLERDQAVANFGYQPEGIACYVLSAPDYEARQLYRLLVGAGHFYTTSASERDHLVASGAIIEDMAAYVFSGIGRPLTIEQVADLLLQPLPALPASCPAATEEVRQVRLCIEVLRAFQEQRLLPDADVDPSLLPWPIKFILAGDVDGDGRDELIIAPAWEYAWYQNTAYTGNGFWVLKYNTETLRWNHLSP